MNYPAAHASLVLVTSIAFIANFFLIFFASKVPKKSKDIILIIMIASVEYLGPILIIIEAIYKRSTGHRFIEMDAGCNTSGFLYLFTIFIEMALSALLAVERLSFFVASKIINGLRLYLTISSLMLITLLISNSATNNFELTEDRFTCIFNVTNSVLASFTFFYSLIIGSINLTLVISCYYQITRKVNNTQNFLNLNDTNNETLKFQSRAFENAVCKIFIILSIYGISMAFSILSFLLEGVFHYSGNLQHKGLLTVFHFITAICFLVGVITTSIVILFTHTGISIEAEKFLKKVKRLFSMCL
ncbi:hypothetical protein K502DRAFT_346763 [Neoconidiobolus thromboides FSU 785]|nr:hypothetical protein K502DRAFT_346763 [Neoconidiobolus thromboides FSU 785]